MQPITIRLSEDTVKKIDEEMKSKGFSSRSEYIRTLIKTNPEHSNDVNSDFSDENNAQPGLNTSKIEEFIESSIRESLKPIDKRVTRLEHQFDEFETSGGGLNSYTSHDKATKGTNAEVDELIKSAKEVDEEFFNNLRVFLQSKGIGQNNIREILVDACKMLQSHGPLKVGDLKEALFKIHDGYSSSDSLWSATIRRFDDEVPGLNKEEHGTYTFDKDIASDQLDSSGKMGFRSYERD